MKKRILQCLSLILCAALLAIPAAAAETSADEAATTRPGPVQVWGTLTWLDDGGLLVQNSSDSAAYSEVILHGESIICLDAVTGDPMDIQDLKDGDTIYAWVGPAMTLSLPPHATAILILGNIPADYAVPQFYEIASVTPQAMAAIYPPPAMTWTEVTATDGTTLTITDEAALTPYLTKNIVRLEDLIPGTRILVWSDAQGEPEKVLVFPYAYRGYVTVADGMVSVNGSGVSQDFKTTDDGDTLLPIRAVAEALGMKVHWDAQLGAVVSYGDDMVKPEPLTSETLMTAMPGGAISVVNSDGSTSALSGTCLKENGVTYVSQTALLQALDLYLAA